MESRMKPRILIVDDQETIRSGFRISLTKRGYSILEASSLSEARAQLASTRCHAVLLDMRLPDGNALDWLPDLKRDHPDIAVIMVSAYGDIPHAVEAMRRGADHFLAKPVDLGELEVFLRQSVEVGRLRRENSLRKRLAREDEPFWGDSAAIREAIRLAGIAAERGATVLLQGETGAGKGVLARWIHGHSDRAGAPFVEVSCSSLRGSLLADELFGHVKGAFTSAVEDRDGLLDAADGGTLFLDDVTDMDPTVQPQFLNAIERKTYRRVGEVRERRSDFRLITATNRDIGRQVRKGLFREDLYFRVNVFPIELPPLRERKQDLDGLIRCLLGQVGAPDSEVTPEAMRALGSSPWRGNVRELKNVLERAVLLAGAAPLAPQHFPGLLLAPSVTATTTNLDETTRLHINRVLDRCGGDTDKAAQALGISRAALYRRLRKYRDTPLGAGDTDPSAEAQ